MLIVEILERMRVPLLGSLDGLGFVQFLACSPSLLWLSVGQVTFSGRTRSDAANYLYVVWLASRRAITEVITVCRISEYFYGSLDT
jgi:hypothetical protein